MIQPPIQTKVKFDQPPIQTRLIFDFEDTSWPSRELVKVSFVRLLTKELHFKKKSALN